MAREKQLNDVILSSEIQFVGRRLDRDDDTRTLSFVVNKELDILLDFLAEFYEAEKSVVVTALVGGEAYAALDYQGLSEDFAAYTTSLEEVN